MERKERQTDKERHKETTPGVVRSGNCWVAVHRCKCGGIHAYQLLDKKPHDVEEIQPEDVPEEIRNHIFSKLPLLETKTSEPTTA